MQEKEKEENRLTLKELEGMIEGEIRERNGRITGYGPDGKVVIISQHKRVLLEYMLYIQSE
jgi:hypothetical protein